MQRRNTGPYRERALASRQQASRGGVGDEAYLPRGGPKKRHAFPMSQVKPDIASTAVRLWMYSTHAILHVESLLPVHVSEIPENGFPAPLHSTPLRSTQSTPLTPLHSLRSAPIKCPHLTGTFKMSAAFAVHREGRRRLGRDLSLSLPRALHT